MRGISERRFYEGYLIVIFSSRNACLVTFSQRIEQYKANVEIDSGRYVCGILIVSWYISKFTSFDVDDIKIIYYIHYVLIVYKMIIHYFIIFQRKIKYSNLITLI